MKHLKYFEGLEPDDIKRYIVWNQSRYEILYYKDEDEDDLTQYSRIWVYDFLYFNGKEFIDNKSITSNWINLTSKHLLFSSDDLEECKNFILFNVTQNKYNL